MSTLTPEQLKGQKAFGAALPPDLPQGQHTVHHRPAGGVEPRPRLSGTPAGLAAHGGASVGLKTLLSYRCVKLNILSFHLKNQGGR